MCLLDPRDYPALFAESLTGVQIESRVLVRRMKQESLKQKLILMRFSLTMTRF